MAMRMNLRMPMANNNDNEHKMGILQIFKRIKEPIFLRQSKIRFELQPEHFTEKYQLIGPIIQKRENTRNDVTKVIHLQKMDVLPDIEYTQAIPRDGTFSTFHERDMKIARRLVDFFMTLPDIASLLSNAVYIRERINPYLFYYALSVAILHRPDTKDVRCQTMIYVFPNEFVDGKVIELATEYLSLPLEERKKITPENENASFAPWSTTASEREDEQRLAYFREDIALNLHHWHWHVTFPPNTTSKIDQINQRGELFLYMHHEMMARYNSERFCNNLRATVPFNNFRAKILQGYSPKLSKNAYGLSYPPRIRNGILSDLNRDDAVLHLSDLETWRDRIIHAIDLGYYKNKKGEEMPFDEKTGINVLGNMIEASTYTPNKQFYGDMHNSGHDCIAFSHDPDGRFLEPAGVMEFTQTAMRDPIFYEWHTFIDSLAIRYKKSLTQYSNDQFIYNDITVNSINVKVIDANVVSDNNNLITFWQRSKINISDGLNFVRETGPTYFSFIHLQNEPFIYDIDVTSDAKTDIKGTVRIFLGPESDDRGTPFNFEEQRLLMFEMDKFSYNFKPGHNIIERKSIDSDVTIPFDQTFYNIDDAEQRTKSDSNYCGCGWPQHLLLPKGTNEGKGYILYVMISHDDYIVETDTTCKNAVAFCGVRDKVYPDTRAMGFPFDRSVTKIADGTEDIKNIDNFVRSFKNMGMVKCKIRHSNEIQEIKK